MESVKKLRFKMGLTQEQIAEKTGFTKSHISFLEKKSTKTLSERTVEKLTEIFECSPVELYGMDVFKIQPTCDEDKMFIINMLINSLESEELKNEFQKGC